MIELTEKQKSAVKLSEEWWKNDRRKKPFTIAGVAGSGKTTLLSYIIENLGIDKKNVRFVAYTGTAASVLNKKGNEASTIHRLIYNPIIKEDTNEVFFEKKDRLSDDIKLIIIDEVSMVSNKLLNDVKSFNIPILTCGDPCQLPPVQDDINDLLDHPDIFLDEPLRQSLENPIIYIANKARKGERINFGNYQDKVVVIPKDQITMGMYKMADQIISCKNETATNVNKFYRSRILNIRDSYVPQEGEKLICLRNNWEYLIKENKIEQYLTNGLIGYCSNINTFNESLRSFKIDFRPYYFEKEKYTRLMVDELYFEHNLRNDNFIYNNLDLFGKVTYKRRIFEEEKMNKINKFNYGYCITCHKSQGSEYNNVLFIDEFYNKSIYYKSLYTGITRAKEKLILAM